MTKPKKITPPPTSPEAWARLAARAAAKAERRRERAEREQAAAAAARAEEDRAFAEVAAVINAASRRNGFGPRWILTPGVGWRRFE